jgi:hypothetical protein
MITVVERWHLTAEHADDALGLMQEMDLLAGPPAHEHPGWCGHAQFLQARDDPTEILVVYPWRSGALHDDLVASETELLADFSARYCSRPREITRYDVLPVEVEHE